MLAIQTIPGDHHVEVLGFSCQGFVESRVDQWGVTGKKVIVLGLRGGQSGRQSCQRTPIGNPIHKNGNR